MIRFIICFCLLLSLQATTPPRDYTTSFSLKVNNRLNKPLEKAATYHTAGETIELMDFVAADTEALFISANRDGASDLSTSGLISFQLSDRNSSDFSDLSVNYYLTLLWSVPDNEANNVLKLAITTGDAQQDGLYNDLLNDNVETFPVEAGDSWQVWNPNFANIEIRVFYNNEYLANASITVIRRTPDFPASLMLLPLNHAEGNDTVIELLNDQIQEGLRVSPHSKKQLWKVLRAYDDVFYIVNQQETQFLYADKTSSTTGSLFASGFQPKNDNKLWEIKEVAYGFTIRAVVANLFWNTKGGDDSRQIVLTSLNDYLNARSTHIFTIEAQQDDFLLEDDFFVLTITNPSNSLPLTMSIFSSSVVLHSSHLLYDHFWLMKRVSDGKYILQDFDTHLTLEAIDPSTVRVDFFVPKDDPRAESQLWSIVKGEGDDDFTIESVAYPGSFLSVSNLAVVLGSSYGLRIKRVDSFKDVVQKDKASSLTGKDGNTLTYGVSGPKASIPEFVHLNHRFRFSSSDLTQITPLAAQSEERLTAIGEDSLVWQEGSSDVWRVIPAPHYYGILIQLRNERTGAYLTSSFPDFITVPFADEYYETTFFKVYSLDILPPQIQWDEQNPLVLSPPQRKLVLTADNLIQQQDRTRDQEYNLAWNVSHVYGDVFILQKSTAPYQALSGGYSLLADFYEDDYPRHRLWRITKNPEDGSVQLLNLQEGRIAFLDHHCNAQASLTVTGLSSNCTDFYLQPANNFIAFSQQINATYFNLLNLKVSSADLVYNVDAQQQLQSNQTNQNRTQDWVFKQVIYLNQPAYIIYNRVADRALAATAAGALSTQALLQTSNPNYLGQFWTITQHANDSNVLRIQSVVNSTLFLASTDSASSGATWKLQTGRPSEGLIPTIGLQAAASFNADFSTLKITIARAPYQFVFLNSDGKQAQATLTPASSVQWTLIPSGNYYRLQNVATGYYLSYVTTSDSATDNITTEASISTTNSQLWEIKTDPLYNNVVYTLRNVKSGRVLTTRNPTDTGIQVLVMSYQPTWGTQRFKLTFL